jgi:nesprin-1
MAFIVQECKAFGHSYLPCMALPLGEVCYVFCFPQALQTEVVSQASIYSNLLQLKESLFSVASKEDVKMVKLHLEQLDERWRDLPQMVSKRLVLESLLRLVIYL